jgi:hypothetical protein
MQLEVTLLPPFTHIAPLFHPPLCYHWAKLDALKMRGVGAGMRPDGLHALPSLPRIPTTSAQEWGSFF